VNSPDILKTVVAITPTNKSSNLEDNHLHEKDQLIRGSMVNKPVTGSVIGGTTGG
jgi:hypothetical protein